MADKVVTVLTKWLLLVTELTTTMIVSFPFDSGSSTTKSMLIISHGASRIGRGCSSPDGGWQIDFVQRYISQVDMYLPIYSGSKKCPNVCMIWKDQIGVIY